MTLPAPIVDRLVKLCGMLGSAHDGERAAAALKADTLVRGHGLRWPDVIRPPNERPRVSPAEIWQEPWGIDRTAVVICLPLTGMPHSLGSRILPEHRRSFQASHRETARDLGAAGGQVPPVRDWRV